MDRVIAGCARERDQRLVDEPRARKVGDVARRGVDLHAARMATTERAEQYDEQDRRRLS